MPSLVACSSSAPSLPQRTTAVVAPSIQATPLETTPFAGSPPAHASKVVEPEPKPAPDPSASGFSQPTVPREETVVRVLLYHSIGRGAQRAGTKPREFLAQLDLLQELGVEVIRLSQLLDFLDGDLELPRHVAVITIDDGESNGFLIAYPIFKERGLPFALGLATEAIDSHHRRGAMTWDNVREMVDSGLCELASHSVSHRFMTALPDREIKSELERSRAIIEEQTGQRPEAFFYPLGAHDTRVRGLTKSSGYRAAFVAHGGPTVTTTSRFRIPRYDVKARLPLRTFQSFFNHEIEMSRSSRAEASHLSDPPR